MPVRAVRGSRGRSCEDFLHSHQGRTFGAPRLRPDQQRELARATGGEQSGRGPVISGQGSPGVSPLRGGSFRRALRAEALRRDELPRTAAPVTGRSRSPPSRPDAAPHEQGQAVTLAPSAPIAVRKVTATGTERRALSRSAPPASRAPQDPFYPLRRKDLRDPPLSAGASADPAGLTARARPEARPEARAANLHRWHN